MLRSEAPYLRGRAATVPRMLAFLLCWGLVAGPRGGCLAQQLLGMAAEFEAEEMSATRQFKGQRTGSKLSTSGTMRQRILAITPTYPRAFQNLYFTRLTSTIRMVAPPFLWIVVESPFKTQETATALEMTAGLCLPLGHPSCKKVDYVHLETGTNETARSNRGVGHRNRGLRFIEEGRLEGIVYMMDDDNTYAWQAFEEFRKISRVGVLPVALMRFSDQRLVGRRGWAYVVVERPLLGHVNDSDGLQPHGWQTSYHGVHDSRGCRPQLGEVCRRVFNMDMASFAFRSEILWGPVDAQGCPHQPVSFHPTRSGYLESQFLEDLVHDPSRLEPLADDCTDVWVWHAHAEASPHSAYPRDWWVAHPSDLVPIDDAANSSWPFVVMDQRHGIKGRGEKGEPFVYS